MGFGRSRQSQALRFQQTPLCIAQVCVMFYGAFIMLILVSSSHLTDLKSLTHDVLYETYRTEKLSRTVHAEQWVIFRQSRMRFLTPILATPPSCPRTSPLRVSALRKSSSVVKKRRYVPPCIIAKNNQVNLLWRIVA
jgi:septin family protein